MRRIVQPAYTLRAILALLAATGIDKVATCGTTSPNNRCPYPPFPSFPTYHPDTGTGFRYRRLSYDGLLLDHVKFVMPEKLVPFVLLQPY
jgi:hypothetical protein